MENKLSNFSKWGSIYGIITIISGVMDCFTIIGIIMGVPLIFAGIYIRKSALKAKSISTRSHDEKKLSTLDHDKDYDEVFENVGYHVKIMAIINIITTILTIIAYTIYLFFALTLFSCIHH